MTSALWTRFSKGTEFMDTIVIGAGEVGYHLAKELSSRDHNVVVVDISHERLERIEEQLDVAHRSENTHSGRVTRRRGWETIGVTS